MEYYYKNKHYYFTFFKISSYLILMVLLKFIILLYSKYQNECVLEINILIKIILNFKKILLYFN